MKQLTQKLKNGTMEIIEVSLPTVQPGQVLIKNHYSLISAGTEGSTVKTARKGYLGKARERPQQVKQVIDTLKTQGPVQTYRSVKKKLDAYSPLGYSTVGEVIETAPEVAGFQKGDFAACGGLTASHAEVISVPVNLCVKLKPDTKLEHAVYNTLGAIALQGIRQADLRLGETCAVIGLGLLGQLSCLLLKASGVRVIGIDLDQSKVDLAAKHSADLSLNRNEAGLEARIDQFSNGLGCDAIIITAATDSVDPINFSGAIARKRGTIVVVGDVPTGFDREPHYYKKELQVRMSSSYGPGRYDPEYEVKGLDYPPGYVRWTENRNMQAFQELICTGKIDVSFLTTHFYKLEDAPKAYNLIIDNSEPYVGMVIEYDTKKDHVLSGDRIALRPVAKTSKVSQVTIGFIGAGSYAQSHLLPNLPKKGEVNLKGILTATSASSRSAGERFGFEFCTSNPDDILKNKDINTIFVATRHDSHAMYVISALEEGKNVFVEKPLCLTLEELGQIRKLYEILIKERQEQAPLLMVGYNRRFSPFVQEIKGYIKESPIAAMYRINAGAIPADHWIQDQESGGGRIIGEVCHFTDTLAYLTGSLPETLFAASIPGPNDFNDTLQINLKYANGSVGTVAYLANGDKSLPKERIEVFTTGISIVMDDFKTLTIHSKGKKKKKSLLTQDKGQREEVNSFIENISLGSNEVIPFEEIYCSSLVTFKILESIRKNESVNL
ncbi:MAG: bi-domain-containing oxidoreductase [Deltaproteobacteria bacterium]|nr:bi-domain-containing oxidoreductase [Deltaproteobacteria bacterium]